MKKIFVLYICFCFLLTQTTFGTNAVTTNDGIISEKIQNASAEKSDDEKCILKDTQEEEDEKETDSQDIQNTDIPITKNDELPEDSSTDDKNSHTTNPDTEETPVIQDNTQSKDIDEVVELPTTKPENVPSDALEKPEPEQKNTDIIVDTPPAPSSEEVSLQNINPSINSEIKLDITKDSANLSNNTNAIRINEILPNPDGTDSGKEFIEIYNDGNDNISLDGWHIHYEKLSTKSTPKKYDDFDNITIGSHDFITIYTKFRLINSNAKITLYNNENENNENIISQYNYKTSTSGKSWNYDDDTWYEESPTPGEKNNENPLSKKYPEILINEILPNPQDSQDNEFIELYNPTDSVVDLRGWILKDASKTGKYIFPHNKDGDGENKNLIASHSYFLVPRSSFGFALNNNGDETVSLIAPNTQIKSTISYKGAPKDLSYNRDTPNWYWETPTPDDQNIQNPLTKEYSAIYLNEILPNPSSNENTDEFIEIYNPTAETVSLKNWTITDASKTGSYTFTSQEIAPQSYFTIYRSDFKFALNNSGSETISLVAPNNKILSTMIYDETREGISLNRATLWYHARPTPNKANSIDPRTLTYPDLLLSELLPNPKGNEKTDEFIEIYNPNDTDVNLKNWTLKDASKTGSYTFMNDLLIKPHVYFVVYRDDFSFALNNNTETLSLIAPNERMISEVSYKTAREDVSYNYDLQTKKWRWSKHLTPKKKNVFNNLPTITKFDIDKIAYKNVYAQFNARASDDDNEKLKIRWDFGDGRRSYLWKTRHKYIKTGVYHGSLRIQDESEEVIKNFTITVKKYPKHKMKITKIVPNPAGKDSGNEYIIIKNKSKKKINLKDWSIATGSSKKKLVNHPIHKKLIIKPGKTKMLTKKYTAISLPNKTGVVEIRRPNGSVADTKEYGDASTTISDNASYEKIDGVWQWIIPQDLEKIAQINAIITQALANEDILSQRRLERLIAFDAIHNPYELPRQVSSDKRSFIILLIQKINDLLHTTTTLALKTINDLQNPQDTTYITQIYDIPHATNPCEQPTIFTSHNLRLCE